MILGNLKLIDSKINFNNNEDNNYVVCDNTYGEVVLEKSTINFNGTNSLIYIMGGNKKPLRIKATLNCDSSIFIGRNSFFHKTSTMHFVASEMTSIIMGDDCLCSKEIWIRTGDAHPIYSTKTHKRINLPQDVIIGDHVWLGQNCIILKGTQIGSGAIVGANALLSGKSYFSNTSYGGVPAKMISEEGAVFFDKVDLNAANAERQQKFNAFETDEYIYHGNTELMNSISEFLSNNKDVLERIEFYKKLSANKDKNRFALSSEKQQI